MSKFKYVIVLFAFTVINPSFGQGLNNSYGAGQLRANQFGEVFVGNSPFPVGTLKENNSQAGDLHVNQFGEVFVGNSPFSVGKIEDSYSSGKLRSDSFGGVHVGSSPFEVDTKGFLDQSGR